MPIDIQNIQPLSVNQLQFQQLNKTLLMLIAHWLC